VDIDGQQGPSKYTRYHDTMAAWNRWTGLMDWNTGKKPFLDFESFLESGYSLSHFTNLLNALLRHPASNKNAGYL